jgi:uncharacterized protein
MERYVGPDAHAQSCTLAVMGSMQGRPLDSLWDVAHTDPVPTVIEGSFEWDSGKAAANIAKHGVSFPEAAIVFADPFAVYLDDGSGEGRMVVIGISLRQRILYVVHVERTV